MHQRLGVLKVTVSKSLLEGRALGHPIHWICPFTGTPFLGIQAALVSVSPVPLNNSRIKPFSLTPLQPQTIPLQDPHEVRSVLRYSAVGRVSWMLHVPAWRKK